MSRHEIWGEQTNGLRPDVLISRAGTNWYIEIEFLCQSNFPPYAWLKPTNHVASKLEVWLTNGVAVPSYSPDVLAAAHLPPQTTVTTIMRGVERSRRGLQWTHGSIDGSSSAGETFAATSFGLRPAFDLPHTNDILLQITPLLYKVDADEVTAHLVTFPPIRIKLLSNGNAQKDGGPVLDTAGERQVAIWGWKRTVCGLLFSLTIPQMAGASPSAFCRWRIFRSAPGWRLLIT